MRATILILVFASVLISGCAGHSFDCIMGDTHTGCAPGTKGHDEWEQKQQDEKATAEIDDARCQAYGMRGTPGYLACRRKAADDRSMLKPPR